MEKARVLISTVSVRNIAGSDLHFSKLAVRTNVTTKEKCLLKGSMACRENKAVVSKAKVTLELSLKSGVQFPKVDV